VIGVLLVIMLILFAFALGLLTGAGLAARFELREEAMERHPAGKDLPPPPHG